MTSRLVLRSVAVLIAILGIIDPALTRPMTMRRTLVIAAQTETPVAIEAMRHGTALGNDAWASAVTLQQLLADSYDVRIRRIGATERTAACADNVPCVLVGQDGFVAPVSQGNSEIVAAVRVASQRPRVQIVDVTMPTAANDAAVGVMTVELEGRDVAGKRSVIDVLDGDVPVGRAEHEWTGDGHATVPVEWWPLAAGLRRLSVRATGIAADGVFDDHLDVGTRVGHERFRVLVYDPRPSWTSTFLRRAIEKDARLAVRVVARLGPQLQVTSGAPFRLDEAALAEASAVVIGALDGLSAHDVDLLERFVRVRGGSLILVPDRRPTGPAARLLPSPLAERLEPAPVRIGEWRASELLVFRDPRPGMSVLASSGKDAVMIAVPSGNGRIVVSGAMDAWRYRDADDAAFDRAWQSLVADAAAAGGDALDVTLRRPVARPGEDVDVTVRVRAMTPIDAEVGVSATVACGDESPRVLRLWPTGDRRRFEGRFPARASACRVAVSSSAPIVSTRTADLIVASDASRPAGRRSATLEQLTSPSSARVVDAGDETTLAGDVRRLVPLEVAPASVRPMRSPWWIVPFAACLGAEWWLRRRGGLR
jgi:hypothetical protein